MQLKDETSSSLIFDIKRYAINDGPGIRVTVFFKGCPLSCVWCHNPESHSPSIQKMYSQEKCLGCEACVGACEQNACILTSDGIVTNQDLCILCGKCAEACPTKATEMSGEQLPISDIMTIISSEKSLMDDSGGGVTFSGGEPLMHPDLLIPLLDECGSLGIHRCVDTTGLASTELLVQVASKTELFLFDLKLMDSERHLRYTGVNNKTILNNLRLLADLDVDIIIRVPLIEDVNDDDQNIQATAEFIAALPGKTRGVNLLPFHHAAAKKHEKLGHHYDAALLGEPDQKRQLEIVDLFMNFGVSASIGG
ncbi:MAG: glycyl-radical enzyme activating protein [Candidatus Marinimicrobia bacterium]|nr:glycyl-radical enzyme activating protein [Candidatus Neomarinimicrobiota bacterium]MBT3679465.1 glycyl-radical enzyme activating protein [Candidatus Neomarinimicrobiota bacterium]MBT3951066.1 glycyl-radical enzyme activating protein [Candidatus Neomarinimicrobiota bacterium]MBT4254254.1 glycyl-radical enzyme activating protein [Candidatus Neomarinimicrobiota bacterium]MBT4479435.1 glycyl-radical enzyme activating protein [Candidatus Neomarinimicrobiota bacterium]